MSRNTDTTASSDQPSAVSGIGGVTEFRLKRDLGITTLRGVYEASTDELKSVWGIGDVRARKLELVAKHVVEQELEAKREAVFGDGPGSKVRRVAVVGFPTMRYQETFEEGGDLTEELDTEEALVWIKSALNHAGIAPGEDDERNMEEYLAEENIELGWATNATSSNIDENGGTFVEEYTARILQETGEWVGADPFLTHWSAYAEDKDVPTWHAARDRNRQMVDWADDVVCFHPGAYEEKLEEMVGMERFTEWHSPFKTEHELVAPEISEEDTVSKHQSTPVPIANWKLVLEDEQVEDKEQRREEKNAEVNPHDRSDYNPHQDEDRDTGLHYTSDSAEQRPELEEFTDGHGQPSHTHSERDSDVDWNELVEKDRKTLENTE